MLHTLSTYEQTPQKKRQGEIPVSTEVMLVLIELFVVIGIIAILASMLLHSTGASDLFN